MYIIPAYFQEVKHLGSVVLLVCRRILYGTSVHYHMWHSIWKVNMV